MLREARLIASSSGGVTLQREDDLGGSRAGGLINGARDVSLTGCQINGFLSIGVSDAAKVTMRSGVPWAQYQARC